jgi:AcrR family transcriptional regulator
MSAMPSSPPRRRRRTQPERSAATRDALISAARPLFAAHGFAGVGTETIVAAAAVTRGALYHHFADKTDLFAAVVEAVEADVAQELSAVVAADASADPVEVMRVAARAWLTACAAPEVHRIVLLDGPSVLGWAGWREMCQRHVFGLVQEMLTRAMQAGAIRELPVVPLTHVFMGASDEAALYVAQAPDAARARSDMVEALDLLIQGITVT